ncbi:MAG: hypothetical protein ACYDBZ_12275 [Steroidobacteraceae bacterium]
MTLLFDSSEDIVVRHGFSNGFIALQIECEDARPASKGSMDKKRYDHDQRWQWHQF